MATITPLKKRFNEQTNGCRYVRYKYLYISEIVLCKTEKVLTEMTKFRVFWETWATTAYFFVFSCRIDALRYIFNLSRGSDHSVCWTVVDNCKLQKEAKLFWQNFWHPEGRFVKKRNLKWLLLFNNRNFRVCLMADSVVQKHNKKPLFWQCGIFSEITVIWKTIFCKLL